MGIRGVKWQGLEADHSSPASAEVKNMWSHTSTPRVGHLFFFYHFTFYEYVSPKWTTEGTILRSGTITSAHSSF
jgi:hypothetical protein